MIRPMLISLALLSACASANEGGLETLNPSASVVQREIMAHYDQLLRMNMSVGEPESRLVTDAVVLDRYRRALAPRLDRDLAAAYGEVPAAESAYLVLAERPDHYVAFVVRVAHASREGAFSQAPGLIYRFDKDSTEVREVRGNDY